MILRRFAESLTQQNWAAIDWERIQGGLPVISRKWRAELIATKKLIGERP